MNLELTNKSVVVVGVGPNLGWPICEELTAEGALVTGIARRGLDEVPASRAGSVRALLTCDAADPMALETALEQALRDTGHLEAIIANVGPTWAGPFDALRPEDWRERCSANIVPMYNTIILGSRHMKAGGSILAVGSVSALQPGSISTPDHGVFKAGLINLIKRASNELAPQGISVNLISPGLIDDDRPTDFTTEVARRLNIPERAAALAEYVKRIPIGRAARSKEIARFAAFMVSPLSRYVTGQNIIMDGGYTKGLIL